MQHHKSNFFSFFKGCAWVQIGSYNLENGLTEEVEKWCHVKLICDKNNPAWKVSVFGVFLVCIFQRSDWIRRDKEYISVLSPNEGKYGPEKLWIRTIFTQCEANIILHIIHIPTEKIPCNIFASARSNNLADVGFHRQGLRWSCPSSPEWNINSFF